MKEKIIEILQNNLYAGVLKNVYTEIADEILALGWYPKEFVEWSHDLKDTGTIFHNPDGLYSLGDYDLTLDELYEYWKKLPK